MLKKFAARINAFMDRLVCRKAVLNWGLALEFVPDELKTKAMCLAAVERSSMALRFVPRRLLTKDICLAAFPETAGGGVRLLHLVPEELRTADVCRTAVRSNGRDIEFGPEALLDEEICRFAVQERWNGDRGDIVPLQYVPERFRTADICRSACAADIRSLAFVPDAVKQEMAGKSRKKLFLFRRRKSRASVPRP